MKKAICMIFALVLLAGLCTVGGLAAWEDQRELRPCPAAECFAAETPLCRREERGCGYTDADDDGVCDNREESECPSSGDGTCEPQRDGTGNGNRRGGGNGRHCRRP